MAAYLILASFLLSAQTVHVVRNNGLEFSPDAITITVGDTVDWQIGGSHKVLQVSQATYDVNGTTALDGGFEAPFGGGKVAFNSVGTFYYVCTPHASLGMKGIVTVEGAAASLVATLPTLNLSLATLAEGTFQVRFQREPSAQATLRVLDLSGRVVQQQSLARLDAQASITLDLTPLPRGTYLIELRQAGFAPAIVRVIR